MLLEIKQQKNGVIVLRAPDGELYPFDTDGVDKENADKLFAKIGRTIIEILADPDQPELKTEANGPHVRQSHVAGSSEPEGDGSTEGALRGFLDALVPGLPLSRGLDFLQSMSGDSDETGS